MDWKSQLNETVKKNEHKIVIHTTEYNIHLEIICKH